jgi:cell division protein FtsI/penicillin-binding protein 2
VDWCTLILADLDDGSILAMANRPNFDPDEPLAGDVFRSAATQAQFQPGSVIKPLFLAMCVERGLARPGERVDCNGDGGGKIWNKRAFGHSRRVEDDHLVGVVDLEGVIAESSNIGAVRIGLRLGGDGLQSVFDTFRLGQGTGLPLPFEASGRLPLPRNMGHPVQLALYTGPSVCFGYEFEATPVQLLRAFATLVTGHQVELQLLGKVVAGGDVRVPSASPNRGQQVFSPSTVAWVRGAMGETLRRERGTGRNLGDDRIRALIGGKTGTSYRRTGSGTRIYCASFVGFAPVEQPRFIAICVAQKSSTSKFYGGTFAAPAVRDLLLEALDGRFGSRLQPNGAPAQFVRADAGQGAAAIGVER